ncbi:MAG: porin, partial [Alphaproteobacteria bacterium]|nr:porin [Alphaproteobacteria bacterium]
YDLADIGQYYLAYQKMMAHWNAVFPGDILELRYEDMVAGQEQQTRRLLEFCGLPWDAGCLDFHGSERLVKTASAGQVRRPIYGGSVGKWKKYARHLQPLLDVLGDVKTALALAAACGLVFGSPAAQADLHLDLGGYARSYVVYSDQDETTTPAPGDELRHFQFRRDMEMHFTGEKTLESGLTIGLKSEVKLGLEAASGTVNSITGGKRDADTSGASYIYFSGGWGKFFLGANEGAAYQLQVAAPSADTYVDGVRIYLQTWSIDAWDDGLVNLSYAPPNSTIRLGYDHSNFGKIDRATYVTPRWNGLQLGASFAPENVRFKIGNSFAGAHPDDRLGKFENAYDLAARWDGKLGDVKIAGGIGYSAANPEVRAVAGNNGSADHRTWSAGLNLGWKEWSIGGAWRDATTGVEGPDNRQKVVVAGLAWDSNPLHLGATWYQQVLESNAFSLGLADDITVQRVTLGGWYQLVDGMTLRSTVSRLQVDNGTNATRDPTQWQLAIGTEITF